MNLLLVGFGAMSKLAWFPLLSNYENITIVGIVDNNRSAFDDYIVIGKVDKEKCFFDFDLAINSIGSSNIDAVIVVTPPETHEEICIKSLEYGFPVLCEKPLACSIQAAERIKEKSKQTGVPVMVSQNRRHTSFIHTLRKLVQSGEFGKPGQVFISFRQIFTRDSFRDKMQHPLILDMANHHFDSIRYVLGEEPISVYAYGWNPNWSRFADNCSAVAVFEFPNNNHVVYEASWHSIDVGLTSNGCDWRIECENGVILCINENVYVGKKGCSKSGSYGEPFSLYPLEKMDKEYIEYIFDEFMHVVNKEGNTSTSVEDNIGTLKMVFATCESIENKCKVLI